MVIDMKEKDIKTYIYSIIVVLSFILVAIGASLAIVYYKVNGNNENGNVDVKTAYVTAAFHEIQGFNDENVLPGWSNEMKFEIINTSTEENAVGRYSLVWDITKNEIDSKDFVYTLTGESTLDGQTIEDNTPTNKLVTVTGQQIVPTISFTLGSGIINTGVKHSYVLKVSFLESGENQNEVQGKTFNSTIVAQGK
jgi:hypothetical protein